MCTIFEKQFISLNIIFITYFYKREPYINRFNVLSLILLKEYTYTYTLVRARVCVHVCTRLFVLAIVKRLR